MRKQFKNIPIGSIITPCANKHASAQFKKTKHLRRFRKDNGCMITRLKDGQSSQETNLSLFWNIKKMGEGPTAFRFTSWSKY